MKKLIAILFLFFVGAQVFPIGQVLQDQSYVLNMDGEQPDSECKEEKKELKDFIVQCSLNHDPALLSRSYNSHFGLAYYLHPVLDQQTPPPDRF